MALILTAYLINGIFLIPQSSLTYDEMDHWSYGKRILKHQPQRVFPFDDASTMPVTGLNALPRALEQISNPDLRKNDAGFSDILHGRYVTLFICLLTGLLIYGWSRELFGDKAALLSLFLFAFSPNLLAHETLLTTDAYAALFTIATLYSGWRFIQKEGWGRFTLFAFCLALSQVVKPSLLHLFFITGIVALVLLVTTGQWRTGWRKRMLRLGWLAMILLAVINLAFFFQGTGQSLADYHFHSKTFLQLRQGFLSSIPIPLPVPYLEGIDLTMYMNDLGAGHPQVSGPNYLLGETRTGGGFWYYYLVCFLFKTPISVLILVLGIPCLVFSRKISAPVKNTILAIMAIVIYVLLVFGLTNRSQVGIRHVLMIYPLLYVAAGAWVVLLPKNRYRNLAGVVLGVYTLVTFYRFYPNLIAYHNELIGSSKVYKVMASSNIDFGQSAYRLEAFLRKNPDYRIPDSIPRPGKYIQGVDAYLGLMEKYRIPWLNDHFKPVGQFDHSFLLFDITEDELRKKGLR